MTERKCLVFNFADIEVREREFLLIKGGERLPVEPTAFRVLLFLLRSAGRIVSKEEIVASVWNDVAVSDNSLTRAIAQLRRVLDDDPREPQYILTVPTLGYRFLSEVKAREDGFSGEAAARAPSPDIGPAIAHGVVSGAVEEQRRGVSSHARSQARKILFVAVAAALLVFAAVLTLRLFRGARSGTSPNPPHLAVEQRLTSNPSDVPVHAAVISADGKYLAYADSSGLYLRQISSGETRRLSLPKDFVAIPRSWYPDGTHLMAHRVYGWSSDINPSLYKQPSLYKLSILGGEPQEIVSDAWAGSVSPDGSRIAYLPLTNRGDLWIMDADGGNPRKIVSGPEANKGALGQDVIYRVVWSPNGQHLAYIKLHYRNTPDPVEPIRSLRFVDPDGGGASVVLEDARLGQALWWSPEDRILFSYREDPASAQLNFGVYFIRIDGRTGRATGPPQAVTKGEGSIGGMTGTTDGKRLALWRSRDTDQAFLSDYDPGIRQWNEPRRLILDANVNEAWAWTADSKAVFFTSNRNGTWKLFKQAIDETSPEVLVEGPSISEPRLSADGTHVLYLSSSNPDDPSFPAEVMAKPVAGGAPRVVMPGKGIFNFQCAMAPSTLCLFSQVDGGDDVFHVFDLEHGAGRELLRMSLPPNGNWSLSSDGSKLAIFLDRHRIRFFSVATGAAHDVTVKDWSLIQGDWGTGQTIFMPSQTPAGVPVILEVDQTGKAKVVLQGKPNTFFDCMIQSPDARHAIVEEYIPTDNNAWIVSDF